MPHSRTFSRALQVRNQVHGHLLALTLGLCALTTPASAQTTTPNTSQTTAQTTAQQTAAQQTTAQTTAAPETLAGLAALPTKTIQNAQPTLDLLVNLKLLNDLLARQTLTLDAQSSQGLRTLLTPLQTQAQLRTADAQKITQTMQTLLTPQRVEVFKQNRAEQEQKIRQAISRGAFATENGVNQDALMYAFLVPGGISAVWKVTHTPDWNPYRETGSNATLLARLLSQFTGQYR